MLLALDSAQSQKGIAGGRGCLSGRSIHTPHHNQDIGVSGFRASLESMNENTDVQAAFFDSYTRALLDRDAARIADFYAVPAQIEFPGQRIAVTDASQTKDFFAAAFGQYEKVKDIDVAVEVVAATGHSIWVDVTWRYHGGAPDERNMYQLVRIDDSWKIGVLTPLTLE